MILENKTEVTVPAVMAMQKAMNRQGQLARYLIAGLFLLGAIWQIGYLIILGTWIQSYFYGILFCALVAGFLLIMPIWSNKKVLKQVTQQLCNSSAPLINHYYFQPQFGMKGFQMVEICSCPIRILLDFYRMTLIFSCM